MSLDHTLIPPTMAQRIVHAKAKIRDTRISYRVPESDELALRVDSLLRVLYLVFNEGYSPSSVLLVTRADLSQQAIRLTRLVAAVLPCCHPRRPSRRDGHNWGAMWMDVAAMPTVGTKQ